MNRAALHVLLLSLLTAPACGDGKPSPALKPVACSELRNLRDLSQDLVVMVNPRTGNSFQYALLGDGVDSDEVLVLFPGTGGVFPDWPVQMLSNSAQSPLIAGTPVYRADQDVSVSLCHSYRILLFDYAGVGNGIANGDLTLDRIADDVDAMLGDVEQKFGISTRMVNLIGWSLGSVAAQKFAFLNRANQPNREIGDLVLIASKPGGVLSGTVVHGNQAPCVTELFKALENPNLDVSFRLRLQLDIFRLTFPFVGQAPYSGADSGCSADIDIPAGQVSFSVTLNECRIGSPCFDNFALEIFNRETQPWKTTEGVPNGLYVDQREEASDWDICYCARADSGFRSADCQCSETPLMSETNGGTCQCAVPEAAPQSPTCSDCVDLGFRDQLNVINGPEDLVIQFTYGNELVEAYRAQFGQEKANLLTYPGSDGAGHSVLLQHPGWIQEQIFSALTED